MADQKVGKGRILLFRQNKLGAEEWPALVTKVHSESCVDLYVMSNIEDDIGIKTAICFKDIGVDMADGEMAWRWPPRV